MSIIVVPFFQARYRSFHEVAGYLYLVQRSLLISERNTARNEVMVWDGLKFIICVIFWPEKNGWEETR